MFELLTSENLLQINNNFRITTINRKDILTLNFYKNEVVEKWEIIIKGNFGSIIIDITNIMHYKLLDERGERISDYSTKFEHIYTKLLFLMEGK